MILGVRTHQVRMHIPRFEYYLTFLSSSPVPSCGHWWLVGAALPFAMPGQDAERIIALYPLGSFISESAIASVWLFYSHSIF